MKDDDENHFVLIEIDSSEVKNKPLKALISYCHVVRRLMGM